MAASAALFPARIIAPARSSPPPVKYPQKSRPGIQNEIFETDGRPGVKSM
jgi:hypothetical protein